MSRRWAVDLSQACDWRGFFDDAGVIEATPGVRNANSVVYVVENVETLRIKIGRTTTSPWRRIYELQAANDCLLRMVGFGSEGRHLTRRALQARFVLHRVRGEWFDGAVKADVVRALHLARTERWEQLRLEWKRDVDALYALEWSGRADWLLGNAARWVEEEDGIRSFRDALREKAST